MMQDNSIGEEQLKKLYPKLYESLFGNGDRVKHDLAVASLFVMTFECLKDTVEDHLQSFFCHNVSFGENGKAIYEKTEKYYQEKRRFEREYKQIAKKLVNKDVKYSSTFQAACAWFYHMNTLTDEDMLLIISCETLRNDFAHELFKWIFDDKVPNLEKRIVNGPLTLHFKISNWWIRNFEQSISPEDYEHFSETDMQGAASFHTYILQMLIDKVFSET